VTEAVARRGDVRIAYEALGDPANPALLLIMGLGGSLVHWEDDFCAMLVARGFRVIRFDNRDVGRSSRVAGRAISVLDVLRQPERVASYRLEDMADDAFAVLDDLGVERAHIAGMSLGGHIGQKMAVRAPGRVLSLASIMSSTGGHGPVYKRLGVALLLARGGPFGRVALGRTRTVEVLMRIARLASSPGFPRDEAELRQALEAAYDRGIDRDGVMRQMLATLATGERRDQLRRIDAPTVVIHGLADRVMPPGVGRATAHAISNAVLVEIPGMGHELPRGAWPRIVGAITMNAARTH